MIRIIILALSMVTLFSCGNKTVDEDRNKIQYADTKAQSSLKADGEKLINAVSNQDEILVREYLDSGANSNYISINGMSGLTLAARRGYSKIADILIKAGADIDLIDANGNYPITEAVMGRNPELVIQLIQMKANIDVFSKSGLSPLAIALRTKSARIAEVLILNGSRVDFVDNKGRSALEVAGKSSLKKTIHLISDVEKIQKFGIDLEHARQIVKKQRYSSFRYIFLKESLIKTLRDTDLAFEALSIESNFIKRKMLKAFIKEKFNLGLAGSNKILLHAAVKANDFDNVKLLLRAGVDPNMLDHENRTAITYAVSSLSANMVSLLHKNNAKKYYKLTPDSKHSVNACGFLPNLGFFRNVDENSRAKKRRIKRTLDC